MAKLEQKDLTLEQVQAIEAWWLENDPDQISYDFMDNTRYAIEGNKEQEEAYEEIRSFGCCGFCDVVVKVNDTQNLLYGFNYGH